MSEETTPSALSAKVERKRKRHAEDSSNKTKPEATAPKNNNNNNNISEGPSKKKRKKVKNHNKKDKQASSSSSKQEQDVKAQEDRKDSGGIDEAIGKMDGRLLADYFAQKARKLDKELTAVELEDLYVSG